MKVFFYLHDIFSGAIQGKLLPLLSTLLNNEQLSITHSVRLSVNYFACEISCNAVHLLYDLLSTSFFSFYRLNILKLYARLIVAKLSRNSHCPSVSS